MKYKLVDYETDYEKEEELIENINAIRFIFKSFIKSNEKEVANKFIYIQQKFNKLIKLWRNNENR